MQKYEGLCAKVGLNAKFPKFLCHENSMFYSITTCSPVIKFYLISPCLINGLHILLLNFLTLVDEQFHITLITNNILL